MSYNNELQCYKWAIQLICDTLGIGGEKGEGVDVSRDDL